MDPDWTEVACTLIPPPGGPGNMPEPDVTMAFDTTQELLWTGNGYGRVSSLYSVELQRYTSYFMHPQAEKNVRQILFNDRGVITLGSRSLHMALRRGIPLWNTRHPEMKHMRCMAFTSRGASEILVAGLQDTMLLIDLSKGEVIRQIPAEHHYRIMKKAHYICAATNTGSVDILDPVTFKVLRTWQAHSSFIHDMDITTDFAVTCGGSLKQQGSFLDPYVNIFDLRNMTSMSPIAFPPLAAFVRMHPRLHTAAFVASRNGLIHAIDLMNPNTSNVRQVNIMSSLTEMEISPSGEALVLADTDSYIHLWGSPTKIQFTEFPGPTEWATPEQPINIEWTPETPLNAIGLPYYRETLLSAWPPLISDVGAPPVRFDPTFLESLAKFDYGRYGPNTRGMRPNQVEDTRAAERPPNTIQAPRFLSQRDRRSLISTSSSTQGAKVDKMADALATIGLESGKPEAPSMYRALEIRFSKFGVDDFDFGYYNKTRYAGLENHIANSYANSLLQLLHFTPLIRNLALQHAASSCLDERCLLCELGFLFDMLQKAEGSTCQATNVLKTLNSHQQAHQLRLIEEENPGLSLVDMLQGLARYLFNQITGDYRRIMPQSTAMEEVLAMTGMATIKCTNCKVENTRAFSTYINDLKYPAPAQSPRGGRPPKVTFSRVLKSSVEYVSTIRGWCSKCQRYKTLSTTKFINSVPKALVLNAGGPFTSNSAEFRSLWSTPGWLPEEIGIIVDNNGQFFCYEGEDLQLHLQRGIHNIVVYSLIGMAINVDAGPQQKQHLAALVNVAHAEPNATQESRWHLFNDFLVCRTATAAEALAFNTAWKTPAMILFQMKSYNNKLDTQWKDNIDTSVLYIDERPDLRNKTYRVLDPKTEHPGPGTIVALDTEFVALKQPEIEVNSEGQGETIRPMTYSLARVSVVRGQGVDEGLPFIDDYITITEPVVDYLTLFSGITKEDLDPRKSRHSLVPLKKAYKKLWVLLNLGCKFLGHGMKQDFRVINIQIPKAQIIDTIDLFYLKSRLRRLSLAFLAYTILKENIQLETHDSIEDARTALKLYRKYLEYEDAGILETILAEIYRLGKENNFKPPRKDDQVIKRTDTPPMPADTVVGGAAGPGPGPSTPSRPEGTGLAYTPGGGAFMSRAPWELSGGRSSGSPFR